MSMVTSKLLGAVNESECGRKNVSHTHSARTVQHPLYPYIRYAPDDTCCILKKSDVDVLPHHLNNICPTINFTKEVEEGGSLPFLDTRVTRKEDGKLDITLYRNTLTGTCTLGLTCEEGYSMTMLGAMHSRGKTFCRRATEGGGKATNSPTYVRTSTSEQCSSPSPPSVLSPQEEASKRHLRSAMHLQKGVHQRNYTSTRNVSERA